MISALPQNLRASIPSDFRPWDIDHPLAGLSVMVGLFLSIYSLPIDVEPRDALRTSELFLVFSVCLIPALAALRDPKSLFRAEHVLLMAPVYWLLLDPLQGRYENIGVGHDEVEKSFTAIALFIGGAWFAFIQRPWRMPKFILSVSQTELSLQFYFGIGVLAFTLAFFRYAISTGFDFSSMAQELTSGRWEAPWTRGTLGGSDAFVDHLSYFGYLLPPLMVTLARRVGWTDARPICLAILGLILSAFLLQGGGRRLLGVFIGTGIIVWFISKPNVRLTTILGLGLLVVGLLFLLDLMLSYRGVGVLGAMFDEPAATSNEGGGLVRVDDNFFRLAQTTGIFQELHGYTTWQYVLWVAVRPVPRLFWPGKPLNPGFDLAEFVGLKEASLSASVVGELFMAGGFVAVILGGWFYGRLSRSLSQFLAETHTSGALIIYSIGLLAIFTGMRSMIELVLTSYVILAWLFLVHAYDGFRGRTRSARL